jgi:hypothetical protein
VHADGPLIQGSSTRLPTSMSLRTLQFCQISSILNKIYVAAIDAKF